MKRKFLLLTVLTAALMLLAGTALASSDVPEHEHWAYCDNPTVCAVCGEAYSGTDIRHENGEPQYNETEHWQLCTRCSEELYRGEHFVSCIKPGVCRWCEQPFSGPATHAWGDVHYNETEHWTYCLDCGAEIYRDKHSIYCDKPGVCDYCGQPCTDGHILHRGGENYQYDEQEHWQICTGCGEMLYRGAHYAYCDNSTICTVCGAAYSGNIIHTYDWEAWQSDAASHWHVCTTCGEITDKSEHYANCTDPTVCAMCGAAYTGDGVRHHFDWENLLYDDNSHWAACTDCGTIDLKVPHRASCTAPGVCEECGVAYTGSRVSHQYDWVYHSDETSHWLICGRCGEIIEKAEHFAYCNSPGVCGECGAAYTGGNIEHHFDWENLAYDEDYHWEVCTVCGTAGRKYAHSVSCTNPNVCDECGAPCSSLTVWHDFDYYTDFRSEGDYHWWVCRKCGAEVDKSPHVASCKDPTHCVDCGAAYNGSNLTHDYNWENVKTDGTYHWWICDDCGKEVYKEEHSAYCTNPTVCIGCDQPYSGSNIVHNINFNKPQHDDTYHWYICVDCGEIVLKYEHLAYCDSPNVCASCGLPYTGSVFHYIDDGSVFSYDAANHWTTCTKCGQTWTLPHAFDDDGICIECGYEKAHEHVWVVTAETAPTCTEDGSETYTCSVCSETKTEVLPNLGGHSWKLTASTPASCTKDGSEAYTCSVCSETKTEVLPSLGGHDWKLTASTPASCTEDGSETYTCSVCSETKTEVLPNLGGHDWKQDEVRPATCKEGASVLMICSRCHIWTIEYTSDPLVHELKPVETTDATCTEDGSIVSRCDNCGETATEIIPALGHAYGAYAPSGDDSHTAACSRCGATISKACQMKEQKLGTLTCSICSVCGRTVMQTPAPAETAAPAEDAEADETAAPAPAPVEVKVIENAVIEAVPAENATEAEAKPVVPKEAVLVVLDCSAITSAPAKAEAAEAAEPAEEAVPMAAAFSVSLVVDGEEVELTSAVKVRIPLTEENTPADLTGMKLVLILPSGETVDVEFEIVDGELIFTTDMLGMFAFVPVEA